MVVCCQNSNVAADRGSSHSDKSQPRFLPDLPLRLRRFLPSDEDHSSHAVKGKVWRHPPNRRCFAQPSATPPRSACFES